MDERASIGHGSAPGKVILFGEHAVVYHRPALAVPVTAVRAEADVAPAGPGEPLMIYAADLDEEVCVRDAGLDHPLAVAARLALDRVGLAESVPWRVTVRSTIPIAGGLGSGAAVSAAIIRAIVAAAGCILHAGDVAAMVQEVDKLHHGTPSGVDSTVIAYGQPVYFVRGHLPERFAIGQPFTLVIADTGVRSPTKVAVGDVRLAWEQDGARYEALFDRIGAVVETARQAIAAGENDGLGPLMDANHALLCELGVSSPELERLAAAARLAGAAGAKLSGGGRGGNLIALVSPDAAEPIASRLRDAGAARVIITTVGAVG
jgi:mevalonate kinase